MKETRLEMLHTIARLGCNALLQIGYIDVDTDLVTEKLVQNMSAANVSNDIRDEEKHTHPSRLRAIASMGTVQRLIVTSRRNEGDMHVSSAITSENSCILGKRVNSLMERMRSVSSNHENDTDIDIETLLKSHVEDNQINTPSILHSSAETFLSIPPFYAISRKFWSP
eukprot:CAMPEP_0182425686 /NCGR_PEP_ID=MMETSP1167-20130531/12164_1 /TAXON_ID=2988 /ORGANISM="Mallomonas Sp, Strain CCMP3275" /LENGTH=167 /DNA_ID=CAMNT_0024606605 /DNA_START=1306 /DNA_END=1809 /DNA_ORIENTATION=+